ncbi:MAG: hypothetical protein Q9162_006261 [Coniocarpon cinnabarinum]
MSSRNSKLRYALDKHKGRNIPLEKQRKHEKEVTKRKQARLSKAANAQTMHDALKSGESAGKVKDVDDVRIPTLADMEAEVSSDDEDGVSEDQEDLSEDELEEFDDEGAVLSKAKHVDKVNGVSTAEAAIAAADGVSDEEDEDGEVDEVDGGVRLGDRDGDSIDEEENASDVPLSDLSSVSDSQDITPHQKLTKNNIPALQKALKSIQLPLAKLPFSTHQSITSAEPTSIPDTNDDIKRESALYAQSLDAVQRARSLLLAEGAPFTRPSDYFAEMVKTDEHMGKVKGRLVEQATARKASEDAKRQRQLKKYGKQVQQERLKERAQAKREMLDKVSALKRKRRDTGGIAEGQREDDLFDVAVDDAAETERGVKRMKMGKGEKGAPNKKRQAKDARFGFGGKKRHQKSNDAMSSGDVRGYSAKKMKGGAGGKGKPAKRLGKSRRPKKT